MRILIVKTSALGDIVHCFHTVRYLRQCLPQAHIAWIVEKPFSELVTSNPDVNQVFIIDSKRWRKNLFTRDTWKEIKKVRKELREKPFDLLIDLQGNIKSALVTSQVHCPKKVGFATPYVAERPSILTTHKRYLPPPGYNIRDDYLYLARQAIDGPEVSSLDLSSILLRVTPAQTASNQKFLQSLPSGYTQKLLVLPGAAWKNKQLTEKDLSVLLGRIQDKFGFGILIAWGSAEEKAFADRVQSHLKTAHVIDRLPLPQLQNLMNSMDLVLAMDSLPLHLAGTTRVPTYSFFGPSDALKYAPLGPRHAFFQGECPYGISFNRRCPKLRTCPTGNCLRSLDVEDVFGLFALWWAWMKTQNIK